MDVGAKNVLGFCLLWALGLMCLNAEPARARDLALPPLTDETAAQFPAIGRLGHAGFRTRQGCTATLIAPTMIVTAAHCAAAKGQSGRVFVAGWSRGDYIAARGTLSEMRHPAYGILDGHRPNNDIALIVLDSPIDDVPPIPLADVMTLDQIGPQVALIGYHRQTPHILSGAFDCPMSRFADGLMRVNCPVINGNSGGPVLHQTEDGNWQVVGVVSSQMGSEAIAVELPDWLRREVADRVRP